MSIFGSNYINNKLLHFVFQTKSIFMSYGLDSAIQSFRCLYCNLQRKVSCKTRKRLQEKQNYKMSGEPTNQIQNPGFIIILFTLLTHNPILFIITIL